MLCRNRVLGAVLAACGVGILGSLILPSGVLTVLLGVGLIGLGCVLWKKGA
jgi:hypothetical protein